MSTEGPASGGMSSHMRQLDGLRTIAVGLVLYHHFMPRAWNLGVHWGAVGVDLFFVLSGFLITGILLRCRKLQEDGHQGVLFTARQFYARRFLRIFPLYYAVLALVALGFSYRGGLVTSLWTYTYNFYAAFNGFGQKISHFWTLAVEEQFYLVWPWVVLTVSRRWLPRILVGAILLAPVTRMVLLAVDAGTPAVRAVTLCCLDTLVLGALLAWQVERDGGIEAVRRGRLARWLLGLGLPVFLGGLAVQILREPGRELAPWEYMLGSLRGPFFFWLVVSAACGFKGVFGRLLSSRPMVYVGQISYGVYVFHAFALLLGKTGLPVENLPPPVVFLLYTALTLAVSAASWHLFEAPINALKKRFPYRAPAPAAAGPGASEDPVVR